MQIPEVKKLKCKIRKEIQDKLRGQDPSLRGERSRAIQEKLLAKSEFASAKVTEPGRLASATVPEATGFP